MTNHWDSEGKFFISDFDETLDELILPFIDAIRSEFVETIEVYVNTEGGDAHRAFSLVSLIETAKEAGKPVSTVVLNQAASSGSMVAISGTKGLRLIAPTGTHWVHYGHVDVCVSHPVELDRVVRDGKRHFNKIYKHYKQYTDISDADLTKLMMYDHGVLNADEAIDAGFADALL